MPSAALLAWHGERSNRFDELIEAHSRVGGAGAGRRTDTEQINWALILRLSAEFQGFVRELHTLGVEVFAERAAPNAQRLESVITILLTQNLQLDRGNAAPGDIGAAFDRFGLSWWPALSARDRRTDNRRSEERRVGKECRL